MEKGMVLVAETMIKNGEGDEKISQYTGLSIEEVKLIRKQLV
jgi:hypothetical protein